MTDISELINLEETEKELKQLSQVITSLTDDLIKIEKLSKLIQLYIKSPSNYTKLTTVLTPEEVSQTKSLTTFSPVITQLATSSQIKEMQDFTKFSNNNIPELTNAVNSAYSNGIQVTESFQKIYDQKIIEVEKLRLINPLDLIEFGQRRALAQHFNTYSNALIKMVSNFFIQSLKETTQPHFKTKKGKINFKDTIRSSMKYEGDPYELKRRSQALRTRRTKPTIYILIDVSGSQSYGIYISVALAYAFLQALPDYEIVLYTSSTSSIRYRHNNYGAYTILSKPITEIEEAEKKDYTERHVAGSNSLRFNKKSLIKYSSNPARLYALLTQIQKGNDNDYHFITKALGKIITEDSIIIAFGDHKQMIGLPHNDLTNESPNKNPELLYNNYLGSARKKIKNNLQGKCFSFHTDDTWEKHHLEFLNSVADFATPPNKSDFNFEDYTFYPASPDISKLPIPKTYGDWARQIINILSGRINSHK